MIEIRNRYTGAVLHTVDAGSLSRADLSGADLSGAYLSGADLSGADLSGANGIDARRCTPLLILADQVGPIRAYKLVTKDYTGPTKPGLYYRVGDVLEDVEAETDPLISCARGVNLATLDWVIREWKETYRIMLVELLAVKPIREPLKNLQTIPQIFILRED